MNEETQASPAETVVEETTQPTEEKTPDTAPAAADTDKSNELKSALAQKDHFKSKLEKVAAEKAELEAKLRVSQKTTLDVEDYIDISASLEGLDQREKSFLAEQHKLSGKPLRDIRSSEDFSLWQSAYRTKIEKENALKPSSTQADSERPKTLNEKLASASLEEKEKILSGVGLWKSPRPRADRRNIGTN